MTDYELQDLERKRQRAQLLAQTEAPKGNMVSGIYVKPNALEYLASGLRQYSGNKQLSALDQEQQDLRAKRQGMDSDAMAKFAAALRGEPARDIQPATPMDDEGNMMPVARKEATALDPMAGYSALMGAYDPQMRQAGMQGMLTSQQEAAKRAQTEALAAKYGQILSSGINPQQAIAMGVPVEMVKSYMESPNYGKVKGVEVNGQIVNPYDAAPIGKPIPKQANPYSDMVISDATGAIVPNAPLINAKKQVAAAGASRNSTTVINKGQDAFDVELGKLDAKELETLRESAKSAQAVIGTVNNLRAAEKQGAYSGGGADARLAAANLVEGWTGIAPKGLVGSQIYNAEANKLILDRVKALGANPSNADREFLQKTVPQLAANAQARAQMADWMEKQATRSIKAYQDADSYARKNRGLGGFNSVTLPANATGQDQVQQLLDKYK